LRKRFIIGFAAVLFVTMVAAGLVSRKMGELQSVNQARSVMDDVSRLIFELDLVALKSGQNLSGLYYEVSEVDDVMAGLRRTAALIRDLDNVILSESLPQKGCVVCHQKPEGFVQELQFVREELGNTYTDLVKYTEFLPNSDPGKERETLILQIAGLLELARTEISSLGNVVFPMISHTNTQVAQSIVRVKRANNLILIVAFLLVLVAIFLMSISVVGPVSHLIKGTEAIAEGDYSYRVRIRGRNEAAVLAERFNTMAQVLANREKSLLQQKIELEALNDSLERKVRERTRQLQESKDELKKKYRELEGTNAKTRSSYLKLQSTADELEKARTTLQDNFNVLKVMNRELKHANEVKNKFLSIMSHELRTPLTVINGYLSLVLEKDFGRPSTELKDILAVVKEQSRNQLWLIEELLDLTRIESGEFKLYRESLSVDVLISKALENFRPRFEEKEIELTVWVDRNIPAVYWDFQKMLQVMQNLLDNSAKFTPEGGEIGISAQFKNAFVEISVRDSGIGIPKDQIEHVFERFYQADSSSTRQFGGSGLGLSIVHEIILAHQGKIFVESGEGEGTCFLILLPIGDRERERKPEKAPTAPQEGFEREGPPGHGEKILVVDDDEAFLKMMKMLLPREGYEVHITSNPERALGQAKRYGTDLVILDLMMPHLDGFEVCRRFREDEVLKDKPILVVSAAGGVEVVQKVMEAGADAQVTKPFNQGELLTQINRLLKTDRSGAPKSEGEKGPDGKDS